MGQGSDRREREYLADAHRAHLREMTAARQAAERAQGVRCRDAVARRAKEAAYKEEMARIAAGHRAWLHEQGISDPLECGAPRLVPRDSAPPD